MPSRISLSIFSFGYRSAWARTMRTSCRSHRANSVSHREDGREGRQAAPCRRRSGPRPPAGCAGAPACAAAPRRSALCAPERRRRSRGAGRSAAWRRRSGSLPRWPWRAAAGTSPRRRCHGRSEAECARGSRASGRSWGHFAP